MSAISSWTLINKIDGIINTSQPWTKKLEAVAEVILFSSNCDAVWLVTLPPLPSAASGLLRPEPADNPDMVISLSDTLPPASGNWPEENSILWQALNKGRSFYSPDLLLNGNGIDYDLGDILLGHPEMDIQAIVPMYSERRASGAIIVGNRQPQSNLNEPQKELLEHVARHLALTLQNANLTRLAQKQAEQLTALNHIAQTITSSLDLDQALRRTIASIDDILDVEAGSLILIDPATNELYFKLILRGADSIVSHYRLKPGEGIAGWVIKNGQPALVNDVKTDPRFSSRIDAATGFKTRSVLCSPVMVNGEPIGALEVLNKNEGRFTTADQMLVTSMTAALGIAVQNAQLIEQLQAEITYAEEINNLTSTINAGLSLSETAQIIVRELKTAFNFDYVLMGLLDESKRTIQNTLLDKVGRPIDNQPPLPVEESIISSQLVIQETSFACNFETDNHPCQEQTLLLNHNIKTALVIVLKSKNTTVGTLILASQQPTVFNHNHLKRSAQLSPALSIALEKARLIDIMEKRAIEMEDLNLLGEKLLAKTDPEVILEIVLDYIPKMLPAEALGLLITSSPAATLGLQLPQNASPQLIEQIKQEMIAILEQDPSVGYDQDKLKSHIQFENSVISEDWEPKSKLVWPILTLRGSLGVIYLAYGQESRISVDVMRLFSLIVSRITGAIENARLFTEIENERATMAAILTATPNGILLVDDTLKIILDNPAAYRMLEHNNSQSGKLLTDITANAELLTLFKTAKNSGNAAGEFTNIEDKTFYTHISPVYAGQESLIGWLAVMQNVTHFKELGEAKDHFVNAVSHDLRSPLSSISIANHLMKLTGPVNEQQSRMIQTIDNHIKHMTRLIDDLLDVGKIEANIDMEREPHAINSIIVQAVEQLKSQAQLKNQRLKLIMPDKTYKVESNPNRLQQVVTNLISNAIKYTPEAGLITVKLYATENKVLFQVKDNGVGIPQDDQPHIFDKFYRVKGEHMAGTHGSGLGLAISKSIIEKYNGKIWVDSNLNAGSAFTFMLPLFKDETG